MDTKPGLKELNERCEHSITKMNDKQALEFIAKLIDDASDASFERGVKRGLYLLDQIAERTLNDEDAIVEYLRANAWAARSHIVKTRRSWFWDVPEHQEEFLALSRAITHLSILPRSVAAAGHSVL